MTKAGNRVDDLFRGIVLPPGNASPTLLLFTISDYALAVLADCAGGIMVIKRSKPMKSSVAPRERATNAMLDITTCDAEGRTPLHLAAFYGYAITVRKMLLQHADVNARDHIQRTPGHWPAYKGHLEIVTMLVEYGADVNARDNEGRTLLRMAIIGRQSAMETFLRLHGAVL